MSPRHDHDSAFKKIPAARQTKTYYRSRAADPPSTGDEFDEVHSLDENIDGDETETACPDVKVLQYKVENERLKELLRTRTHDLREKCSALHQCEVQLAEAVISQTADDRCANGRQIQRLARDLKDRAYESSVEFKQLRDERDQAASDLAALSGKMTSCKAIAEEQAKLLQGQLDTIRKFEIKTQGLEKILQEMQADREQITHDFECRINNLSVENNQEIQMLKTSIHEMEAMHYKEIALIKRNMHDMRAGYKEERAALEEQIALHQQRAALQDRKIKKYHHGLELARSELAEGKTREIELKNQLHLQAKICQDTTKEFSLVSKELERLNNVSDELREQEERMEQLWVDNARLVQLLAESDEYQNLLQEMQSGKGLVYCPSHFKTSRLLNLAQRYGAGGSYGPVNPNSEREQWVPVELYELAMAFRKQRSLGLEMESVQEFLRIVSAFWRERHKRVLAQVKGKHDRVVADLKRQLSQRVPYEQVDLMSLLRNIKKQKAASNIDIKRKSLRVVQSYHDRLAKRAMKAKALKSSSQAPSGEFHDIFYQEGGSFKDDAESFASGSSRRGIFKRRFKHHFALDSLTLPSFKAAAARKKHHSSNVSAVHEGREKTVRKSMNSFDAKRVPDSDRESRSPARRAEGITDERDFYSKCGEGSDNIHRSQQGNCSGVLKEMIQQRHKGVRHVTQHDVLSDDDDETVNLLSKKPKKGCLRTLAVGLCLGDVDEAGEKMISPGRITSRDPTKSNATSLPENNTTKAVIPKRRMHRIKGSHVGSRSLSGSSSV